MDRAVTLLNLLLTPEARNQQLNLNKVRDELLLDDNLELLLCKIFYPLIKSIDLPYLINVSKHEMYTLVYRVFTIKSISRKQQSIFNSLKPYHDDINTWVDIQYHTFKTLWYVPLINERNHHEIKNFHVDRALASLTSFSNHLDIKIR